MVRVIAESFTVWRRYHPIAVRCATPCEKSNHCANKWQTAGGGMMGKEINRKGNKSMIKYGTDRKRKKLYRGRPHRNLRCVLAVILGGSAVAGLFFVAKGIVDRKRGQENPQQRLLDYMDCISEKRYGEMYGMLAGESVRVIGEKDFVERNSAIYEGIGMQNMNIDITGYDGEQETVAYNTSFDTVAGRVSFGNEVRFHKEDGVYRLVWNDTVIFPGLGTSDKVRVYTVQAKRGEILDRNGKVLAGTGTASAVGVVPGKLENREKAVGQLAELLGMKQEEIEKQLSAKWVKDDSFVPLKTLPKIEETAPGAEDEDPARKKERRRQKKLLDIAGVAISDTEIREYPLKEAAAHLVGYVQSVTAEDLEEHAGEGYTASSVIGKSGAEGLFERELRGENGCRICITSPEGAEKEELAEVAVKHGKDIRLTIDAGLQSWLYESYKNDKSCSVSVNPFTGEVLALVSTPSYDNNAFITGMSGKQWKALNEDVGKPLYNRFRQAWCPGSSFKPVMAAVAMQSGAVDPAEDFGSEGHSWQKDKSWGTYYVTTLHTYKPVNLENALIYSDNIYFAKAALKTGAENLEEALSGIGFHGELPFEIKMAQSRYSNTEHIESEIQLADSGYGQGQVLVNPLHMACMYTAFCNHGDMIKPYLRYDSDAKAECMVSGAFSAEISGTVLEGIKKVVNDPHGTGYAARRDDVVLAGKTGTAEIKDSKEDTSGTELGWFAVLTPAKDVQNPLLIVSMVEDVKERGGSGYVIGKTVPVLDKWFREKKEPAASVPDTKESGGLPAADAGTGYDLPIPDAEKEEASRHTARVMAQLGSIYRAADKGDSLNVVLDDDAIKQMTGKIKEQGLPVTDSGTYSGMGNYKEVERFLKHAEAGKSGSVVIYNISSDGGVIREKYIYDGENMFLLAANAMWDDTGQPCVPSVSCTRIKKWRYSDKGWFGYELCVPEYPEVTEMVDGSRLVRVRPMDGENRRLSEQCVRSLGYAGNNLLCSDWDKNHLEKLDYNGVYEYFYEMKYGKKYDGEKQPHGIPEKQFENLIMEYLPVTSEMIKRYAHFDKKHKTYLWTRLGCFNYDLSYFGTSVPEVTGVRKNRDGTVTLTVDAVCEMVLCDEAVITHELTVRVRKDGSFQYLGNKILNGGEKDIPGYRYRIERK